MGEHQAARVSGSNAATGAPLAPQQKEFRSGVFAKAKRDAGGGWGFVLIDLVDGPRAVALTDGVVVGASSRDARVEGPGVSPEHVRVTVRSDGCYLEDLGTSEGTYVGGVRARRIGVTHGDVVRLGRQLAIFVERDLSAYAGPVERSGGLLHGPKQRRDWIGPVLDMAKEGSCICIEGPPGTGKRSLARMAAQLRERAGEVVVLEGGGDTRPVVPAGVRPTTWLVLNADRVPRPVQLEIAHSTGRAAGVSIIATCSQALDRATSDGQIAPWFATLFSSKRVAVPPLEGRREDVVPIVRHLAERRGIALSRFTPELLEALVRAGWPNGVPQLDAVLAAAADQSREGPLSLASVAGLLGRATRSRPSLPPSADPALARARLEDALGRANGSVASAARALGMSRQAIYREADRLGLDIARRKTQG